VLGKVTLQGKTVLLQLTVNFYLGPSRCLVSDWQSSFG